MVAVVVRVQDPDGCTVSKLTQGFLDAIGKRQVLIVNDEHPVRPGGNADMSAGSGKYVDVVRDLYRPELHGGETLVRLSNKAR